MTNTAKVTVVDSKGKEHLLSRVNAREAVELNGWKYKDNSKASAPAKADDTEAPTEPSMSDGAGADAEELQALKVRAYELGLDYDKRLGVKKLSDLIRQEESKIAKAEEA